MQQIGGRMRAVPTPHGHVPQANSTIIDITQGITKITIPAIVITITLL
jgi:hypothetical protein